MNSQAIANRILQQHRAALQSPKPTGLTLATLLMQAADAGYAAALVNMRTAEAVTTSALITARVRSRL